MIKLNDCKALLAALCAAALMAPSLAWAADDADAGWRLRVNGSVIDADGRADIRGDDGGRIRSSVDVGGGLGVSGEYRFHPYLGVELGLLAAGALDTRVRVEESGQVLAAVDALAFRPLTAGLNIHPWTGRRGDLYLGPLVAFTQYGNLTFAVDGQRAEVRIDDDFCFGGVVGLDVAVGRRWLFNANVKYLATDLTGKEDGADRFRVGFNPIITGVGFGYRF